MADTDTLTVRLSTEVKSNLEALATSTQRSKSWLAAQAIAEYLEREAWQIEQIQEALQIADSDDATWVSHETVMAELDQKIASAQP